MIKEKGPHDELNHEVSELKCNNNELKEVNWSEQSLKRGLILIGISL